MQQLSCSSGSLFTVTMLNGNFIIFPGILLGSDQKVVRLRLLAIGTGENDPLVGRNPPCKCCRTNKIVRREMKGEDGCPRILNPKRKILQEIATSADVKFPCRRSWLQTPKFVLVLQFYTRTWSIF